VGKICECGKCVEILAGLGGFKGMVYSSLELLATYWIWWRVFCSLELLAIGHNCACLGWRVFSSLELLAILDTIMSICIL